LNLFIHHSAFPIHHFHWTRSSEDQSASLRSLRAHVRVVPGSLFRGRPEGGRLSLEQETRVRVLPPESLSQTLPGWRKRKTRGAEVAVGEVPLRVRLPPPASQAGVVQMADTPPSEGGPCEFESHLPYSILQSARVAQHGRGGSLKKSLVRVRPPPRAPPARVAQAVRGGSLKNCTVESSSLSARMKRRGRMQTDKAA
jgi:hypothetical protein